MLTLLCYLNKGIVPLNKRYFYYIHQYINSSAVMNFGLMSSQLNEVKYSGHVPLHIKCTKNPRALDVFVTSMLYTKIPRTPNC